MTSETRTVIEITDIAGIQIECRECKAMISYPIIKSHEKIASRCPNCNADLFTLTQNVAAPASSETIQALTALIRVLRHFEKPSPDLQANLRLQLAAEKKTTI
jgi:uncharacterized paraquat-inducible protein A